ncbi:uncharacterized protein LOC120530400 isoform X2 [Polypterus senegalus]|nr:uncharacterized protein LOC120530400 isoform X2 [Polypterus senegalus]
MEYASEIFHQFYTAGCFILDFIHTGLNLFALASVLTLLGRYFCALTMKNSSTGSHTVSLTAHQTSREPSTNITEIISTDWLTPKKEKKSVLLGETQNTVFSGEGEGLHLKTVKHIPQKSDVNNCTESGSDHQLMNSTEEELYQDVGIKEAEDGHQSETHFEHDEYLYLGDGSPDSCEAGLEGYTCFELRKIILENMATCREFPLWINANEASQLPEKLFNDGYPWINQWNFDYRSGENPIKKLQSSLDFFQKMWMLNCCLESPSERLNACECFFSTTTNEEKISEAVKFLMLYRSIQLYNDMENGKEVPFFCRQLFSRTSSQYPYNFMINHLNQLTLDSKLTKVEEELLQYTLLR